MYHNSLTQFNNKIEKSSQSTAFLVYYIDMLNDGEKLGAFIVPTGVGASIGGFAGDASVTRENLQKFLIL